MKKNLLPFKKVTAIYIILLLSFFLPVLHAQNTSSRTVTGQVSDSKNNLLGVQV